jgi:type I restriction enzyme S subunit
MEEEIRRFRLRRGDVLLTEGGDPDKLGRGTYWQDEIDECIHQNHIFRVRVIDHTLMPEFVSAQIGSEYGKSYFLKHAKQTTGIATINRKVLGAFPLGIPPLNVQRRVVRHMQAQMVEATRTIGAVERAVAEVDRLPAALLRQVFSGGL